MVTKINKLLIGASLALGLAGSANAQKYEYLKPVNVSYESTVKADSVSEKAYNFTFAKPQEDELQNNLEGKALNVFYQTNKNNLNANDSLDMTNYLSSFEKAPGSFLVKGFADIRGKTEDNYQLALRRANAVKGMLKTKFPASSIETIVVGEAGESDKLAENRKSQIVPYDNSIANSIGSHPADYYLIDLSGSMNRKLPNSDKTRADAVRELEFPEGSQVYVFSGAGHAANLSDFYAQGPTPLYASLDEMIEKVARDSSSIHVFTDGLNSATGPTHETLIDMANRRSIKITTTAYQIPKDSEYIFQELAKETGGSSNLIR